jgi:hypothetical protein
MNYPLARSARTVPRWKLFEGKWCARLPGEDRIRLYLPGDTPAKERRAPTGFDMNVMFRLMAELQRPGRDPKNTTVEFPSSSALLRDLGLTCQFKNREQLKDALSLWRDLALSWEGCWYVPGPKGTAGFGKRGTSLELPPPITKGDYPGQRVVITLASEWVRIARAKLYYAPLPLPLPNEVSGQNLALTVLTSATKARFSRRGLARKIAVRGETGKLEAAAAIVARWFEKHGGEFELWFGAKGGLVPRGKVAFYLPTPLKIPRWQPEPKRSAASPDEVKVAKARAILSYRNRWSESDPALVLSFVNKMLKRSTSGGKRMSAKQAKWLGRLFYKYAGDEEKELVERLKAEKRSG